MNHFVAAGFSLRFGVLQGLKRKLKLAATLRNRENRVKTHLDFNK
jgi:hypothetical protein